MIKKVSLHVPATSANLGPGFDVLGVALAHYNELAMTADFSKPSTKGGVHLELLIEGEGSHTLPHDASNLVIQCAMRVFERVKKIPAALHVHMINRIPLSRGMGSSAAATLAGIAGANRLCGSPLSDSEVLDMAVAQEGHPDNLVPAMVGGFCLSGMEKSSTRYLRFDAFQGLRAIVCVPEKSLSTKSARSVLPKKISLKDAVFTSSRTGFLIGALLQRRYDLLGFAMEDVLHQPARAKLIPGLLAVIQDARKAGAYGAALSGAGSCIIAFARPGAVAQGVGRAMQRRLKAHGLHSTVLDLSFDRGGLRIEE